MSAQRMQRIIVSVSWVLSGFSRERLRLLLLCALGLSTCGRAATAFNSVYISEFLAENGHGIKDTDGDYSGWIELYNGGSDLVNLGGWFLSDTPANLTRWRFPGVGILPGNYLVIFASGKNRTNDLAQLHTNFRLAREAGYLALSGPATNLVSDFGRSYPKQSADVSYGRARGEPGICGYFHEPTPGKPNDSNGPGFAPKVVFSRASASFIAPFELELSCDDTNAVIRYTLDGKLPSQSSAVYERAIEVTNSAYVRARTFQTGLLPGPPASETYLSLSTNVLRFTTKLPVLVMDTFGSDRVTSARSAYVQLALFEPGKGRTSLTNTPSLTTRGGYHLRGSTSAEMPQPGYALQFLDEFDHEQHLSALELPANSDWVLYAPTPYDPVMIHNPFVHQLSRDIGRYSPRTRFIEVFVARHHGPITARDYYGLYVLEEKIKVGKHRVAIDRLGPDDLQPPEVTGGYLLKFDRLGPWESGFWAGGAGMVYVEPKEPVIRLPQRAAQREYIRSYFDDFNKVLHSPSWKDPVEGYRAYIDVDSWIDFHVLEVLSGNVDIFHFSTFFYKPRGGKITYGPHWDFDRALGS
ncbi:MAG TPA: CotH kinase family protein, partial [Patescibacteria group bacterium]|nr:CotH kinase family protein [Patescibacteria group bacterium]